MAYASDENGKSPRKNLSYPEAAQNVESECSLWGGSSENIPYDVKEHSHKISNLNLNQKVKMNTIKKINYDINNENVNYYKNENHIDSINNDILNYNIQSKQNIANTTSTSTSSSTSTSNTTFSLLFVSASRCIRFAVDFGLCPQLISELDIKMIFYEMINRRQINKNEKKNENRNENENENVSNDFISSYENSRISRSSSPLPSFPSSTSTFSPSPSLSPSPSPSPSPFSPSSFSPSFTSPNQNKHVQFKQQQSHNKKNKKTGLCFSEFLEFIAILGLQDNNENEYDNDYNNGYDNGNGKKGKKKVFSSTFSKVSK